MKKQKATTQLLKQDKVISKNAVLFMAFIEGALVISVELLGAKMLTPLYGNSLIVWTAVVGITIAFLALGYFVGGILSQRKELVKKLSLAFAIASLLILLMPSFAGILFEWLLGVSVYLGSVIAAVLLLGPALFTLGITSPILIQQLVHLRKTNPPDGYRNEINAGKTAGIVYAISTLGGIIFTFFIGFFALPNWGISMPILAISVFLFLISCYLYYEKKYTTFIICFFILTFKLCSDQKGVNIPNSKILYTSEGLLGQLKVVDIFDAKYQIPFRYLFINGVPQSVITNDESQTKGSPGWPYIHKMAIISSLKREGQNALLLGIGGGSIAGELSRMKMKADMVDLDVRMFSIAKKYFYLNDSLAAFICDDGRHFMRTSKKQYDLIVMDVFNAEVQPSYMFTRESFTELKKILSKDGIMVFQFGEQTKHEGVSTYQSVCNTLLADGFKVFCNFMEAENVTDVLIISSLQNIDFSTLKKENLNQCCVAQDWINDFIKNPAKKIEKPFANGIILTDDRPMLDILNAETVKTWREWAIRTFALPEIKSKRKLFK